MFKSKAGAYFSGASYNNAFDKPKENARKKKTLKYFPNFYKYDHNISDYRNFALQL